MPDRRASGRQALDQTVWDHKWGFADTQFIVHEDRSVELTGSRYLLSGYRMYHFLPYVEEVLGITLDLDDVKQEVVDKPVDPPHRNEEFCAAVASTFRGDQFTFDDRQRLLHSHGQTTTDEVYRVLYERLERFADMVFFPESEDDVVRLVELADRHNVCLVPFGGGTSVSCALTLPPQEKRMIVVVDMRRMNRILWVDPVNRRACVEAGIRGLDLEEELNRQGFTCGHEPDSIELSTLGGWIATNASGMKKNRYGNIEQLVEQITLVTPRGAVEHLQPLPRVSQGVQPQLLAFGSEGNLGIITKAVIKIFPKPEVTRYGSLVFPNFRLGVQFLEELSKTDYIPASIRLVDNIQFRFGMALKGPESASAALVESLKKFAVTRVLGFDPDQMVAATIVMEGSRSEVAYQEKNLFRLARKYHGISGGADAGRRGYMLTYAIAYIRDFVARYHIIGETFETSVPWSKIEDVCKAVETRAAEEHRKYRLPGKFYVSYRITQVYHTGVCIYFMMGLYMKGVPQPADVFARIEKSLRQAIMESGGSISHHHGVGKLRAPFMHRVLSPAAIDLVRGLKAVTDPGNVFGIRNNVFAEPGELL
ncbi:MAG: FAD-binding oxidoreductase [Acidobacteriota bacterium]